MATHGEIRWPPVGTFGGRLWGDFHGRRQYSKPSDPVFSTSSGTSMSARNAGRALTRIAKAAELDHVTPHALRHTFASLLVAQGRDPVFVADQLGHSSPAITLRVYAHLFRAAKQANDARNELEAAYGGFLGQGLYSEAR